MTTIKNTERNGAQTEVAKWGFRVGHNLKVEDVNVCEYCHRPSHKLHTGHPDNVIDWRADDLALSLRVEVKATHVSESDPHGGRFSFSQISDGQYAWMSRWIDRVGTSKQAWLWLQMGCEPVDSHSEFKRRVALVNWNAFLAVRETLTEVKVLNLPLNSEQAQTRVQTRENNFHAENLLSVWWMEYKGHGDWWTPSTHPIWNLLKTSYYSFEEACQRASKYPRPD